MQSAGMNILTDLGYFTLQDKERLTKIDKKKRNILIGLMLKKDKQMVEDLENGFSEARRLFLEMNNIKNSEILSIKRDAIYLINREFGIDGNISSNLKLIPKNKYDVYMNINNREHYYNIADNRLDLKGYSKDVVRVQQDYLFKFLTSIIEKDSIDDKNGKFIQLATMKDDMLSYSLPKQFYYDLNYSKYLSDSITGFLGLDDIEDENVSILNYDNNLSFIINLIELVL